MTSISLALQTLCIRNKVPLRRHDHGKLIVISPLAKRNQDRCYTDIQASFSTAGTHVRYHKSNICMSLRGKMGIVSLTSSYADQARLTLTPGNLSKVLAIQ